MERIIAIIEAELKHQEDTISLLKWENEDLKKQLKETEEALENMRRRRPFEEVIGNG